MLQQLLEKQGVEQFHWFKSKAVSRECIYTYNACATTRIPPIGSFVRSHPQPAQLGNLYEVDNHSNESDSAAVSFKCPPVVK